MIQPDSNPDSLSARAHFEQGLAACNHCGLCLSSCPTFAQTRREADSPRGRLLLLRNEWEGHLSRRQIQPFLDSCLQCGSCETACPVPVPYQRLLHLREEESLTAEGKTRRTSVLQNLLKLALPHPGRFRAFAVAARTLEPFRELLSPKFRRILELLPRSLPPHQDLPTAYAGRGRNRGRVALLPGCVSSVLNPGITRSAVELLTANGFDVVLPEKPGCCGAYLLHLRDPKRARQAARQLLGMFPEQVDAVLSTSGFCQRTLRQYPQLFTHGDPPDELLQLAEKSTDLSSFLRSLELPAPPSLPQPVRVAYHDSCHIRHGLGGGRASRELLRSIPGLQLIELEAPAACCGAPGTYAIEQPEMAKALGRKRLLDLRRSGAAIVATDDPGCLAQLAHHATQLGHPLATLHTVEILARAYQGESLS